MVRGCGLHPATAGAVDGRTRVPPGFVKDGQIVLNVSAGATRNLTLDNDWIQFSSRFGGVSHEISIPVDRVMPSSRARTARACISNPSTPPSRPSRRRRPRRTSAPAPPKGRPSLKVVK